MDAEAIERATDAGTRRWLTAIMLVIALLFALKLVFAATLELRTDEAYHWAWSKEGVVSYLDHPPMIAWFVRLGTTLFGDTPFGARFADIIAMVAAEVLLADIVRRRTGSLLAAAVAVLAMESTVHLGGIAVLVEPSIPLILFVGLMFWALSKLEDDGRPAWWLLIGLAAGLALLSKYMAVLFVPAVLAFLIASPGNRRWFRTPWPWVAALICVVAFSPVIWWNAQNDWASFRFQGIRATGGTGPDFGNLTDFLALCLLLAGPVLMPVVVVGTSLAGIRAWRRQDGATLALATAFLFFLGYLVVRSLGLSINTSWPVAMWPFGIAATVINAWSGDAPRRAARRWLAAGIVTNMVLILAAHFHASFDHIPWGGRADPIGRDDGYASVASAVLDAAETGGYSWIVTSDYRTYAALRWHLNGRLPVVQVNQRSRYIGFALPDTAGPGLYVFMDKRDDEAVPGEGGTKVERIWRGESYGTMRIRPVEGWQPDLTPSPDSPLYRWPDLA